MGANVYLHHDGQFFQGNIRTKVRMEEGKIQFIDIDHHVSWVQVVQSKVGTFSANQIHISISDYS